MKRLIPFVIFLAVIEFYSYGQNISVAPSGKASVCYNDGTLIINPSGGTAPYTDSIISGPTNPNLMYPIVLPTGQDTFIDLPSGTFTIRVHDAAGQSGTFTAGVGGTYQFPSMTFDTTSIPGIIAHVTGGLAPLEFAISSIGSNSGFGIYQSSDTFQNMCPGQYWIRVIDSCGNIFTGAIHYSYKIYGILNCANFSKGTLNVSTSGGHPPYIYSQGGITNSTGDFSGLSEYFNISVAITDSCGVTASMNYNASQIQLYQNCTLDSGIYYGEVFETVPWDTLTFICTNCNPPQTEIVTNPGWLGTVFPHVPIGTNYKIIVIGSECGGDTISSPFSVYGAPPISTFIYDINCNSFSAGINNLSGIGNIPIDSEILYNSSGTEVSVNTTGVFDNLPSGTYQVSIFTGGGCGYRSYGASVTLPFFANNCNILMKDSICQNAWELSVPHNYYDNNQLFSIVSSRGDTMPENNIFYNLVPDSSYLLISNDGCSASLTMPSIPTFSSNNAASSVNCLGTSIINYSTPAYNSCYNLQIKLFYAGLMVADTVFGSQATLTVNDTGWYKYQVYISAALNSYTHFDTLCPIDTGWVYVSNSNIPYPYTNISYVCDLGSHGDSVPYSIYGGSIPYTVEVLGYDTLSLSANNGIFKAPHQGNYTILLYDNCGISRSYTFSVLDTCSRCPIAAISTQASRRCAGDTIHLTNASLQASRYQWLVNGQLYSTTEDTMLITDIGGDRIVLRSFSQTGCEDSVSITITDTCHSCLRSLVNFYDTLTTGDTIHIGNHSYSIAGSYTDTLTSIHGCDSIVNVYLTIDTPTTFASLFDTICLGASFSYAGHTYTLAGSYTDTLVNHYGGDSIVTIDLKVYPTYSDALFDTICQGSSINFGGHALTAQGTYIDTFHSVSGCDSVVTLNLTINPLPPAIMISESGSACPIGSDTLIISGGYTYPFSWLKNDSVIEIATQTVTTVAGGNAYGSHYTQLTYPQGIYVDTSGDLYISDINNNRIQKWAAGATAGTTVAGNASGLGGNGTNLLQNPCDVFLDKSGNIYIADQNNNRIMKWAPGAINGTVAAGDMSGQSGNAANLLDLPSGIFVDDTGNIYIADLENNRIQKWAPGASNGTTVAGSAAGQSGTSADLLQFPSSVYVDQQGAVYIADSYNNRIQKWTPGASSGITVAGNANGLSGNNDSLLNLPTSIFVDQTGSLYIGDTYNNRIQKWAPGANSGITVTSHLYINGLDQVYEGVWVDKSGAIYISDQGNYSIQKFTQNYSYVPISFGTYTATVTNAHGCTAVSNAIVLQNQISHVLYDSICQGGSTVIGVNSYNQSGTFIDTFSTSYGCDSIVTLNLTVYPVVSATLRDTVITGDTLHVGRYSYSSAGNYIDTFSSVHGCDSIVNVYLTIDTPTTFATLNEVICPGSSYTIEGRSYSSAGHFRDTLTNHLGGDSIITLSIAFYPVFSVSLHDTVVIGDTLHLGHYSHTLAGSYIDTLNTVHGCDSILDVYLAIDTPSTYATLFDTICQGSIVTLGANSYDQSGPYTDTVVNHWGGDSIVTLNLLVYPLVYVTLYDTVIVGDTLHINGHSYSIAGSYVDSLTSQHGCDSLVFVNLYVDTPSTFATFYDTICQGASVTIGTHIFTQSGIHLDTLINHYGGDSIVTLDLTVYPVVATTLYDTLIIGDTLHVGGHSYSRPGTYADTMTSHHGCDSIIHIHLYIEVPSAATTLYDTICQGYSVMIGSQTFTLPGVHLDTLVDHYGGDSIVTLHLAVIAPVHSTVYDTICEGASISVGGHTYSQPGIYSDTTVTARGCDSVSALYLTVLPLAVPTINILVSYGPSIAGLVTDTLTAQYTDCPEPTFDWFQNYTLLPGHGPKIAVTYPQGEQDTFICNIICSNECQSMKPVYSNSIYTGISDLISFIRGVTIYPNPTQGGFTMDINLLPAGSADAQIIITDMVGQSVMSVPIGLHAGNNKQEISLGESAIPGVYIVQLIVDGQSLYYRIVLEK